MLNEIKNLVLEMVDTSTLPALCPEEIDELAASFHAHLVPTILEHFEDR